MKNNNQNHHDSHVEGISRRDFLRKTTYATAGLAAMGLFKGNVMAQGGKQKLKLISPTFETSPQYLAKYSASDRAKAIMQKAVVIDTLFSALYPLQ